MSHRPTGGIRRLYDLHALVPRLGLFDAHVHVHAGSGGGDGDTRGYGYTTYDQSRIPYDYDELIAAIAPRQVRCTGLRSGAIIPNVH
jgi:hypothetical protein